MSDERPDVDVERLRATLGRYDFRAVANERVLQDCISDALHLSEVEHTREVMVKGGRIDFLCAAVGVEAKVDGSLSALTRQIHDYLHDDRISSLLVVTTRAKHANLPGSMNGKPVRVLWVLSL